MLHILCNMGFFFESSFETDFQLIEVLFAADFRRRVNVSFGLKQTVSSVED